MVNLRFPWFNYIINMFLFLTINYITNLTKINHGFIVVKV